MIRATVRCTRCELDLLIVQAPTWPQLASDLATGVLLCHAAQPHTSHGMAIVFDEDGREAGREALSDHPAPFPDLEVECLYEHCGHKARSAGYVDVPLELVPALVMVFHTAHEGHRMRVTYDGRSYESPAPPEPP